MSIFQRAILTHGGSGSDPQNFDGTQSAAKIGMERYQQMVTLPT